MVVETFFRPDTLCDFIKKFNPNVNQDIKSISIKLLARPDSACFTKVRLYANDNELIIKDCQSNKVVFRTMIYLLEEVRIKVFNLRLSKNDVYVCRVSYDYLKQFLNMDKINELSDKFRIED